MTPKEFAQKLEKAILAEAAGGPMVTVEMPTYEVYDDKNDRYHTLNYEETIARFEKENPDVVIHDCEDGETFASVPVQPLPAWTTIYVCVDEISRHYGGPEEGGWWYDAGEPLAMEPIRVYYNEDKIPYLKESEKEVLQELASNWMNEYDFESSYRGSVLPRGKDYSWRVGFEVPKPYPSRRPHYE